MENLHSRSLQPESLVLKTLFNCRKERLNWHYFTTCILVLLFDLWVWFSSNAAHKCISIHFTSTLLSLHLHTVIPRWKYPELSAHSLQFCEINFNELSVVFRKLKVATRRSGETGSPDCRQHEAAFCHFFVSFKSKLRELTWPKIKRWFHAKTIFTLLFTWLLTWRLFFLLLSYSVLIICLFLYEEMLSSWVSVVSLPGVSVVVVTVFSAKWSHNNGVILMQKPADSTYHAVLQHILSFIFLCQAHIWWDDRSFQFLHDRLSE